MLFWVRFNDKLDRIFSCFSRILLLLLLISNNDSKWVDLVDVIVSLFLSKLYISSFLTCFVNDGTIMSILLPSDLATFNLYLFLFLWFLW